MPSIFVEDSTLLSLVRGEEIEFESIDSGSMPVELGDDILVKKSWDSVDGGIPSIIQGIKLANDGVHDRIFTIISKQR